jgi:hypothetical protein
VDRQAFHSQGAKVRHPKQVQFQVGVAAVTLALARAKSSLETLKTNDFLLILRYLNQKSLENK